MPLTQYYSKKEQHLTEPVYFHDGRISRTVLTIRQRSFLNALIRVKGVIRKACKETQTSREAFERWRRQNANFRLLLDQVYEQVDDYLDDILMTLVEKGNIPAIREWRMNYRSKQKPTAQAQKDLSSPSWDEALKHKPQRGKSERTIEPLVQSDDTAGQSE